MRSYDTDLSTLLHTTMKIYSKSTYEVIYTISTKKINSTN